jgi:hypothetical protein
MTMFMLMEMHPVGGVASLSNNVGALDQIARDQATGNMYIKRATGWAEFITAAGAEVGLSDNITVQTQGGAIQRNLTAVNGVVTLAGTDTIVSNGESLVLKNHSGTVSSGNAGLNSTGTVANVASGAITAVTAGA